MPACLHFSWVCLSIKLLPCSTNISHRLLGPSNVDLVLMTLQGSSRLSETDYDNRGVQLCGWSICHVQCPSSMLMAIVGLSSPHYEMNLIVYAFYLICSSGGPCPIQQFRMFKGQIICDQIMTKSLIERCQVNCLIFLCHSCSPGPWE